MSNVSKIFRVDKKKVCQNFYCWLKSSFHFYALQMFSEIKKDKRPLFLTCVHVHVYATSAALLTCFSNLSKLPVPILSGLPVPLCCVINTDGPDLFLFPPDFIETLFDFFFLLGLFFDFFTIETRLPLFFFFLWSTLHLHWHCYSCC